MGARVRVNLSIPALWSVRDSMASAADTIALVRLRTYAGKDTQDRPFTGYSVKPIWVGFKGARLTPKGGKKTPKGMRFEGGYREYKQKSRLRTTGGANQTAEVDLTLSGALMNNLVTTKATKTSYTIGLSSAVRHYGYFVNEKRPFIGLSKTDQRKLTDAIAARIRERLS